MKLERRSFLKILGSLPLAATVPALADAKPADPLIARAESVPAAPKVAPEPWHLQRPVGPAPFSPFFYVQGAYYELYDAQVHGEKLHAEDPTVGTVELRFKPVEGLVPTAVAYPGFLDPFSPGAWPLGFVGIGEYLVSFKFYAVDVSLCFEHGYTSCQLKACYTNLTVLNPHG